MPPENREEIEHILSNLEFISLESADDEKLGELLLGARNLKELFLVDYPKFRYAHLLQHLESIFLGRNLDYQYSQEEFKTFMHEIGHCKKIKTLNIDDDFVHGYKGDVNYIIDALYNWDYIEQFSFTGTHIGYEDDFERLINKTFIKAH